MQKSERVSLALAAKELGVSMQSVREHMRRGIWRTFGQYRCLG